MSALQGLVDDLAGLRLHGSQVGGVAQGLGVDLVLVLGAGRTGSEPGILGDDLDATDGSTIAWRRGENLLDPLAGDGVGGDVVGGEGLEAGLLLTVGVGIDTGIVGLAEAASSRS